MDDPWIENTDITYGASPEPQHFHVQVSPEPVAEVELTSAVVPDVMIPDNVPSLPGSPVDTTDSGVFPNDFSLDTNQLDLAHLNGFEGEGKTLYFC